jgi:hypothetical protein
VQNPYYCKGKIHTSAPSCHDGPAWPCTGALSRASAVATGNITACQHDDWV